MKEIVSLVKRAQKYLRSAELLLQHEDFESSVSRSYYAMFYTAEALLLTKGLTFSSHKGVITAFGEHFVKNEIFPKSAGRDFHRAFEKRQLGDYEYTFIFSSQDTKELLEQSSKFVEMAQEYLKRSGYELQSDK